MRNILRTAGLIILISVAFSSGCKGRDLNHRESSERVITYNDLYKNDHCVIKIQEIDDHLFFKIHFAHKKCRPYSGKAYLRPKYSNDKKKSFFNENTLLFILYSNSTMEFSWKAPPYADTSCDCKGRLIK